ncbi:KinB-signaling pathway activation protein [Halobacillus salinarum]|uniref:KinB-signaling pathway activation protein n=1 Tax=Halobacillus salinarum TaxID=2932257 RepID=A0ABY4EL27_9BACI|nr:KinB-signaling pathway activation protein [Halobacillus salinarum]UOQ44568.1 KinB-signaling pathway activation protein [Halobacillus salinarum]
MNSRKWVRMFLTTLLLGGVLTLISSFFIKQDAYARVFHPFQGLEFLGVLLFFAGLGFIFSVISQMGFFAYLTIHQFGLGFFRSLWMPIQVGLIGFALFDLVYFRYQSADGESFWGYFFTALVLFVIALLTAAQKAKETNRKAFIPALFFMVVVTTIEWVPALRTQGFDYVTLMIIPLVACNIYQLLLLHRLTGNRNSSAKKASTS